MKTDIQNSSLLTIYFFICLLQKLPFGQIQTWILIWTNFKPQEIGIELPKNEIQ